MKWGFFSYSYTDRFIKPYQSQVDKWTGQEFMKWALCKMYIHILCIYELSCHYISPIFHHMLVKLNVHFSAYLSILRTIYALKAAINHIRPSFFYIPCSLIFDLDNFMFLACNILMSEITGVFKISNHGAERSVY